MNETVKAIRGIVSEKLDMNREQTEEDIYELIDAALISYQGQHNLSVRDKLECRRDVFNSIKRLDILQELIDDDSITEIMINGPNDIFVEREGRITRWNRSFDSEKHLADMVQRIAASSNKIINEAVPIVDARLQNGSRVSLVMNPVALNGPIVTIRKFYETPLSIERMIEYGSITREAADFLKQLVEAKFNIFISGGTGSGKTTFLNALSNYIPKDERIITIEDAAELKLMNVENLVRLEARTANVEGKNAITIRDLIRASLRMRPDRIIVGEVRGAEAVDMLQSLNSGHRGSISTGHSNGPEEMLNRLETMVLMGMDMPVAAIRGQIASAIDIIVHLGRLKDKSRRVLSISEVAGISDGEIRLNCLYRFCEEGMDEGQKIIGRLKRTEAEFIRKDWL